MVSYKAITQFMDIMEQINVSIKVSNLTLGQLLTVIELQPINCINISPSSKAKKLFSYTILRKRFDLQCKYGKWKPLKRYLSNTVRDHSTLFTRNLDTHTYLFRYSSVQINSRHVCRVKACLEGTKNFFVPSLTFTGDKQARKRTTLFPSNKLRSFFIQLLE